MRLLLRYIKEISLACTLIAILGINKAYCRATENRFLLLRDISRSIDITQIRSVSCDGKHFCFTAVLKTPFFIRPEPALFLCSLDGEILDIVRFEDEAFIKSIDFRSSVVAATDLNNNKLFVYAVEDEKLKPLFSTQFEEYPYSVRLNSSYVFVKTFLSGEENPDELYPAVSWVDFTGNIFRTTLLEKNSDIKASDFFISASDEYLYVALQSPFSLRTISSETGETVNTSALGDIVVSDNNTNTSARLFGTVTSVCSNSKNVYVGIKDGPSLAPSSLFEGVLAFDSVGDFRFFQFQVFHSNDPIISCDDEFFYAAGELSSARDLVTINFEGGSEWDILQAFRFLPDQEEVVAGDGKGQYIYVADEGFNQMMVFSRTASIVIEPESVSVGVGRGVLYRPYGLDKNGKRLTIRGFTSYSLTEDTNAEVGDVHTIWADVGGIFTARSTGSYKVMVTYGDVMWKAESKESYVVPRADTDGDGYSDENENIMQTDPSSALSFPSETASIAFDKNIYYSSQTAIIRVTDPGLNKDPTIQESCEIVITSTSDRDGLSMTLKEWGTDSGLFTSSLSAKNLYFTEFQTRVEGFPYIHVENGDEVFATYIDSLTGKGAENVQVTAGVMWLKFKIASTAVPAAPFIFISLFIIPWLFCIKLQSRCWCLLPSTRRIALRKKVPYASSCRAQHKR